MKRLFLLLILLSGPLPARGADLSSPVLSPEETAGNWLQLFDGDSTFGWEVKGEAKVEKGKLVLGGEKETTAWVTTPFFDFTSLMEFAGEGRVVFRWVASGEEESGPIQAETEGRLLIRARGSAGAKFQMVRDISKRSRKDEPQRYHFTISHDRGPLRLGIAVAKGQTLTIGNIRLLPTGLKPIFNGKDLAGWKVYPGKPSKFTVTREGWLNVKNGPGDLQTEGEYGDFVLQLECLSNGKHLNSGIFFRAIPGEYQLGYEAQIRNQFTEKDSQEYKVEDYDPVTHKKTGERLVRSPAVDYGTGAIYRRVPARKALSKDGEWFAMTVAASGRHLATWVNGIQQADWTDNRPEADNARKGYRAKKGVLSIQGHDPTTDLSFRNLRIKE